METHIKTLQLHEAFLKEISRSPNSSAITQLYEALMDYHYARNQRFRAAVERTITEKDIIILHLRRTLAQTLVPLRSSKHLRN